MKLGWMPAKIAIARVPGQLDAQLDPDPAKNPEYAPFLKFPADIAPAERERLAAAGRQAIKDKVMPAFQRLRDFYDRRYLPAASASIAASEPAARHALITKCGSPRTRRRGCRRRRSTSSGSPRSRASARRWTRPSPPTGFKGTRAEFQRSINADPRFFYTKRRGHARRLSRHREARRRRAAAPVRRAAAPALRHPRDAPGGRRQRRALLARRGATAAAPATSRPT